MSLARLVVTSVAAMLAGAAVLGGGQAVRRRVGTAAGEAQRHLGSRAAGHLPESWRAGLAGRLVAAGVDPAVGMSAAIGLRLVSTACALVIVAAVVVVGGGRVWAVAGPAGAVAVAAAPEVTLRRRIARRRVAMARELPRILDLLVISVEAGLGLDQALGRVVRVLPGPLADEFTRLLAEVGAGVPRSEALRGLAARCPLPEVRSFSLAMIQADAYGVSVGPLLRAQAQEVRTRQRQAAQMQAQKAPVKLLVPMVLCVFPALLVVVAGPALLSIRSLLGS